MTGVKLLAVAAIVEALTGVGLMILPTTVVMLLLGAEIAGTGLVVARVAGVALLALGLACWPQRQASSSALRGMLAYNALVAALLGYQWLNGQFVGMLLLPVSILHGVMSLLFVWALNSARRM